MSQNKPATLYTIGYEGRTLAALIKELESHYVWRVWDVRARAYSRRPDYRGLRLAKALMDADIGYTWEPGLGNPAGTRHAFKLEAKDVGVWQTFAALFEARLFRDHALSLQHIGAWLDEGFSVCLLCYEKEPSRCHRSLVAEAVAKECCEVKMSIVHL